MKTVTVLGSTGSIGLSSLDVIRMHPEKFQIVGLSAGKNRELIEKQAREFGVDNLALSATEDDSSILSGEDASVELIKKTKPDIVINGIAGAAGFLPSIEAARLGCTLALANKESLVIGGTFLVREARKNNCTILPVDSEHSAVFQCLQGERESRVRRIILTASGGPFRNTPKETFPDITPEMALSHPTWDMGRRITIDSATMMNKGLEIIEASWLFDIPINNIEVSVHPQSIVHSMVEFEDLSIKAQIGNPDMRGPIAYALSWPQRMPLDLEPLGLDKALRLDFFPADNDKFPAMDLARGAMQTPESLPCIMNASDEVAVAAFLSGRIRFDEIVDLVRKTMDALCGVKVSEPEELVELDRRSREVAKGFLR